MQLLLAQTAIDRLGPRIKAVAPDLDIIGIDAPDRYQRDSRPIAADQVKPDIVWASADGFRNGLLPTCLKNLTHNANAKWAQVFLAGLDNPAFRTIIGNGVRLSKSSAQAVAIAEYVTAHAFSLITPIDAQRTAQSEKKWQPTPWREISQTKWTLVGFGNIGHEIARRVKPFGVHLTVVRRQAAGDGLADKVISLRDLPEVLPETDVVVLACALNDETRYLANDAFFNALKAGSILVNIGRGALVNSDALRKGLDDDKPKHAVLDVFETEPLPAENWMWAHPKIRVTAHTSHFGSGTPERGDELFLENLRRFLAGEPVLNEATRAEVGLG